MFMTDRCYCQIFLNLWQMLKPLGPVCTMAIVIANVVDVITTVCNWNITIVADIIATCN